MTRKRFPKPVETEVLTKCRRRCALCFGLKGDAKVKEGQLAHIDRNSANAALGTPLFCARSTMGITTAAQDKRRDLPRTNSSSIRIFCTST